MDKQEAKLLLQSYRPGGQDALDPAFAEALALARQDPELAAWFQSECDFDRAISERLRASVVPADLRQAIIAGQRSQGRVAQTAFVWWKSPALAWAAAIVLLFAAAFLFRDGPGPHVALATYRDAMTANLQSGFVFDKRDVQPAHIQQWLAEHGNFIDLRFPGTLDRTIGCKIFEFENMKPALICFTLPDQKMVHLFVVDGTRFDRKDFESTSCASKCNNFNTVAWRSSDRVFMLAGNVDQRKLVDLAGQLGRPTSFNTQ